MVHQVHDQGTDLYQFCQSLLEQLRLRLLEKPSQELLSWIEIFFGALDQLKDSFIPELPLELAVLKCVGLPKAVVAPPAPLEPSPQPVARAVSKPRKITEEASDPVVSAPVAESEPAPQVTDVITADAGSGDFDSQKFIGMLSSVSLRSLLKHSQFKFSGNELSIVARYQFEMDKIKEASHQNQIAEALNQMMGKKIHLKYEVGQQEVKKDLPATTGLSNNELQTVFS
jgi:hypothetical protein